MSGIKSNQISKALTEKLTYSPLIPLASFTDPDDIPSKGYVDSVAGGGNPPAEPPADGAELYWKMQEGTGAGILLKDSSGKTPARDAQAATTVPASDTNHTIDGKVLIPTGSDVYSLAFPISGNAISVEMFIAIKTDISAGDQVFNYSQRGTPGPTFSNVIAGMRINASGSLQYWANNVWNFMVPRVPTGVLFPIGYYVVDAPASQVKVEIWVYGSKIFESAAFTPNTPGGSHSLNLPSGGWNKSHIRVFDGERTTAQKQQWSDYLMPWLKREP